MLFLLAVLSSSIASPVPPEDGGGRAVPGAGAGLCQTCQAFFWLSAEAALGKEGRAALGWCLQCLVLLLEPALLLVPPLFCC